MKNKRIKAGFIGAGNMAQAMMKALKGRADMLAVDIDVKKQDMAAKKYAVKGASSIKELVSRSNVVILAVKPDDTEFVLWKLAGISPKKTVISIAAGISIKKIQSVLGRVPVIRVMPNTPALVGEGACAYSVSREVKGSSAEALVRASCKVAIKMDERLINAVTALSGSGPAYFFYIAEAMTAAGSKLGLKANDLRALIGQTMKGAGEMILKSGDMPSALRKKVTSKGGTTERAIAVLEKDGVTGSIKRAVHAAKKRGDEMGK